MDSNHKINQFFKTFLLQKLLMAVINFSKTLVTNSKLWKYLLASQKHVIAIIAADADNKRYQIMMPNISERRL